MAVITKIEKQIKNKDRVNIFLNGEFAFGCSLEIALKNGLKENCEIDEKQLENLIFENEKSIALKKAVELLGKNLKTRQQMKTYLKDKGYSKQIIDYVLEKLIEYNYINDVNYATIYLRSVKHKYGKLKIKNELKLKGVSEKDIDLVLNDFETDEEIVLNLAEKYLKNKEINFDTLTKLYRFLISKGFDYDLVLKVVNKYKEN